MSEKQKSPFPMYRGKPLVRSGDTIYYGNMTDKYVIKIDIKTKKTVEDMEVADKCIVQLMLTDPEIRSRKQIVKTSEKNGLYLALDIAEAWLTRALTEYAVKSAKKSPRKPCVRFISVIFCFILSFSAACRAFLCADVCFGTWQYPLFRAFRHTARQLHL